MSIYFTFSEFISFLFFHSVDLFPAGTFTVLYQSQGDSVYCGQYQEGANKYQVILLTTFSPPSNIQTDQQFQQWMSSYLGTIEQCINNAQQQAVSNLIIDVRLNGGGVICLSQAGDCSIIALIDFNSAQYEFVPSWDFLTDNELYEPYDHRKSAVTDAIFAAKPDGSDYLKPNVTPAVPFGVDTSYYSPGVQYTRGGKTSEYTPVSVVNDL